MPRLEIDVHGKADVLANLERIQDQLRGEPDATVSTSVDYAPYIEYGRGPVTPTDADALRFEVDGEVVFTQRAGPAPPQPFMRPAARETAANLAQIVAGADDLESAVRMAALYAQRVARRRVPVDTGLLWASIQVDM